MTQSISERGIFDGQRQQREYRTTQHLGITIWENLVMEVRTRMENALTRALLTLLTLSAGCMTWAEARAEAVADSGMPAKDLVNMHCVRCHLAPEPTDVSKELWPNVLASMGLYLGFKGDELPDFLTARPVDKPFSDYNVEKNLVDKIGNDHRITSFKPFVLSTPLLSESDWVSIRDYFVDNATPMAEMFLPQPDHPMITGFKPTLPTLDIEPNGLVFTTLVDEENQRLYVGRAVWNIRTTGPENSDDLVALDLKTGKRIGHIELPTEPTDLELTETGFRLSQHGEMPVQEGNGQATITDWTGFGTEEPRTRMLVNGLHRITQIHTHDLNGDGLDDIVASMFGDGNQGSGGGRFSIFWATEKFDDSWKDAPATIPNGPLEGALRETVLVERAGMISSQVADFNNDGAPDIALLTAQAAQDVMLFINDGKGKFTPMTVQHYRPSFGGNSIYTDDMDGDGFTDLVVINGDFSTKLPTDGFTQPKTYHGLRIFRNNGDLTFTESYFYAMHGALKSAITDYDGDGDADIALIAQYPRWEWDEPQTFVYLENKGGLEFAPSSLAPEYFAVWTSIEAADVNNDDKPDIVLGLANWPRFSPSDWTTREIMEGRSGKAPTITFLLNDY